MVNKVILPREMYKKLSNDITDYLERELPSIMNFVTNGCYDIHFPKTICKELTALNMFVQYSAHISSHLEREDIEINIDAINKRIILIDENEEAVMVELVLGDELLAFRTVGRIALHSKIIRDYLYAIGE